MKTFLLCLVLCSCAGCPVKDDPVPPAPDAAPVATCASACARLAFLGCPEGLQADCASTCRDTQGVLTDLHLGCLASAPDAETVRACGTPCVLDAAKQPKVW